MIKHIVVWRLKELAHGNSKATNARLIKEKFESLNGKIRGMITMEVGIDCSETDSSSDIMLYSEFVSRQALDGYKSHPEHKAIVPFIWEAQSERRVIDYEI